MSSIQSSNQNNNQAGFWRKTAGAGAGAVASAAVTTAGGLAVSLPIVGKMTKIQKSLTADEVELTNKLGKYFLQSSGLSQKGLKVVNGTDIIKKYMPSKEKALLMEVCKDNKDLPRAFRRFSKRLCITISRSYQTALGKNAYFHPIANFIAFNSAKAPLSQFHEMGHALNHHTSKFTRALQRSRILMTLGPMAVLAVALFKNKKTEGEKPVGIDDKTTTFIKNNAGKLAFFSMVPMIAEEAIASIRGEKLFNTKMPLDMMAKSKDILKKVKLTNRVALLSYIGGAIVIGIGVMTANKIRDAIVHSPKVKSEN